MCLALPMRVIRMNGTSALCESRSGQKWVDTQLTGPLEGGQWILCFLGTARELIDARRAAQIDEALSALQSILEGQGNVQEIVNGHFSDLVDVEPQLPEFLRLAAP